MSIRAVVFDIGGVLEIAPDLGVDRLWAERLGLSIADFEARTDPIWRDGAVGTASLSQVHERLAGALGLNSSTVDAMMEDIWVQYLGTLNQPMFDYARSLRPRYRTGILSNSSQRFGLRAVLFRDNAATIADIEALLDGG